MLVGEHMPALPNKASAVALCNVRDSEMRLRHSMDVSWQDLPQDVRRGWWTG
jgi:hypothetical protein